MKHGFILTGIIITILFSCKNQREKIEDLNIIDVEYALENLAPLKISDFGKTIRYVQLETNDNCLVGETPIIKVLNNHIVIHNDRTNGDNCLLFDKKDGSFITEIGRKGQGPNEFSDNNCWIDKKEEFLYFRRGSDQLIKFDMKGNFCGNVTFPTPPGFASHYVFTDSLIIGHFNNANFQQTPFALGFFDMKGYLIDTIPKLFPQIRTPNEEEYVSLTALINIADIPPQNRTNAILSARYLNTVGGIFANASQYANMYCIRYKNGDRQLHTLFVVPRMWSYNENIRFKEEFVDTIYTLSNGKLIPAFTFHTGKYHWPLEELKTNRINNNWIFIAGVCESNTFILFQCIGAALSDEPFSYNGLYNKKTGETKLCKNSDIIEDDLTHFMPFTPLGISTAGEFFSFVDSWQVTEWLETNPEALNNEKLSFLKELDEESNPIVILIE